MTPSSRTFWIVALSIAISLVATALFGQCVGGSCFVKRPPVARQYAQPHPAVVRLTNQIGNTVSHTTGAIIKHDGRPMILSCGHLFRDGVGVVTVFLPDGRRQNVTPLSIDSTWDLSAIALDGCDVAHSVEVAAVFPTQGKSVVACGYGRGRYATARGKVLGYMQMSGTPTADTLKMSGGARVGDSGGPIFNTQGQLAAVLCTTDGESTYGPVCGRIREFLSKLKTPTQNRPPTLAPVQPANMPPLPPPHCDRGQKDETSAAASAGTATLKPINAQPLGDRLDTIERAIRHGPAVSKWLIASLGLSGPGAVAAYVGLKIIRRRLRRRVKRRLQQSTGVPAQEEPALFDFPQNPPRDTEEAVQLLRLGRLEGRDALHDALIGQLVFDELDKSIEKKADNAKFAADLKRRLEERFNAIVPHKLKPMEMN